MVSFKHTVADEDPLDPWARYVHEPNAAGIGTVRYPRLVPKDPMMTVHDSSGSGHYLKDELPRRI